MSCTKGTTEGTNSKDGEMEMCALGSIVPPMS